MAPKADWEKHTKRDLGAKAEEEKIEALDETDIKILANYGVGPYARSLRAIEAELKLIQARIDEKLGVKESNTGLAPSHLWDDASDRQRMKEEHPLQVARCTKIIRALKRLSPLACVPSYIPFILLFLPGQREKERRRRRGASRSPRARQKQAWACRRLGRMPRRAARARTRIST